MNKFLKKIDTPTYGILFILFLYAFVAFSQWKKYEWNPSSMVHFGIEFAEQNRSNTPRGAIVEKGTAGDLGSGYDGQIFYYFSRSVSKWEGEWPKGFDESYRAPRIGFPFLIGLFGLFGEWSAIFGMYFWNIFLLTLSYLALREILGKEHSYLSWFYILSPFALGSYTVLVSDSVMVSLLILAYFFYSRERWILFILLSSLAILTKEPALFLLFPLGLQVLFQRKWKQVVVVSATLLIPILWHFYLRITFPNWSPTRLADFIQPLEGIYGYFYSLFNAMNQGGGFRELARILSRFPLVILLLLGIWTTFQGDWKKTWIFRFALILNFFMISTASYYHFWSVYENISRMFTISIPLMIFLEKEETSKTRLAYLGLSVIILGLFLIRVLWIQKTQEYILWQGGL
jgi:hypothetical protein